VYTLGIVSMLSFILGVVLLIDGPTLSKDGSLKQWVLYSSMSLMGVLLMGFYLTEFDVPSPLPTIGSFLAPYARWLLV
jgi:NADH:ubiquinone oxidoreductase subunit 4 (subunit M)